MLTRSERNYKNWVEEISFKITAVQEQTTGHVGHQDEMEASRHLIVIVQSQVRAYGRTSLTKQTFCGKLEVWKYKANHTSNALGKFTN